MLVVTLAELVLAVPAEVPEALRLDVVPGRQHSRVQDQIRPATEVANRSRPHRRSAGRLPRRLAV